MKKGDIVVCIDNRDFERSLTVGKSYIINKAYGNIIDIADNYGVTSQFYSYRFSITREALILSMFHEYI